MHPSNKSKGKAIDRSTEWSPYKWDEKRQKWATSRRNAAGEKEIYYKDPEGPEGTTPDEQHQNIPRSFTQDDTAGDDDNLQTQPLPSTAAEITGGASVDPAAIDPYSAVDANVPGYTTEPKSEDASQYPASSSSYGSWPTTVPGYTIRPPSSSIPNINYSTGVNYNTNPPHPGTSSYDFKASADYYRPSPEEDITEEIGDMALYDPYPNPEQGMKVIASSPSGKDHEYLDPRYHVVENKNQRKFWRVGRVFMMLWTEPARELVPEAGGTRNGSHYSTVWLNTTAYSEMRRFVVVREGHGNSICSPIHTYSGQATLKPNLPERQQHAIIYTSDHCPKEHSYVAQDGSIVEENLSKDPIKVKREQKDPEGDLGERSRLNYSKVYTVEHYVCVLNIGMVDQKSIAALNRNMYLRPQEVPVEKPTRHKPPASDKDKQKGKRRGKDHGRKRHS